ncbi:MAG TPA: peptidylprolyl isomerase [Burkholderiales bacterium]|nr:peptidylprolyl isomerase [Burkholderiales bacterium]
MLTRKLIAAFSFATLLPHVALAQAPLAVDRIVAVVNKEVITASELADQVDAAERQLRRQGTPLPDHAALERQVLDRLILVKAQLQLARESGIRVDDTQLDKAIERIAESNHMTVGEFRRTLERDGVDFDKFRRDVRDQIILARLREREVDDKIQVSDSEIDLFLEQQKENAATAKEEYNVAHILIRIPDQASPEQIAAAQARAEKARAEALAGGDFAKLAATYSDGPDALQGGALGWRGADRLPELFADALKTMKPGDVSAVLRSPAGFHLLKLLGTREAGGADGPPVEQTHVRQILIKTNEAVSEDDARRRLEDLRERIVHGGASFAEMARLYSQDGSAAHGGDLGWVYPGDTVPDFERAMNALKPGEISEPVKSPFGWHLVQVLERRTAGMSADRRRLMARQALRERKSDEAYQEWLRQLRDQTYVELHLDDR